MPREHTPASEHAHWAELTPAERCAILGARMRSRRARSGPLPSLVPTTVRAKKTAYMRVWRQKERERKARQAAKRTEWEATARRAQRTQGASSGE